MVLTCVVSKQVRVYACALVMGLAGASLAAIESAEAARRPAQKGGGYSPPSAEIVVDAKTGEVMHSSNPDAPRYPASITKVMTLFLLFDEIQRGSLRLDSDLTATAHASRQAPSKLGLRPGEKISVEDAIKALVTKSANDVAATIADNLAGSEEAFAVRMTSKARRLGMNRTNFANASGLPNPKQVTTARDLAILGRAIQDQHPQLYRYFSTPSFSWKGQRINTHNRLLGRVEAVDGIKTGFIRASGFNLLTSAKESNRHVVAVVLGGRSGAERDRRMQQLVLGYLPKASRGSRTAPLLAETSLSTPAQARLAEATAPVQARMAAMPVPAPAPANIRSAVVTAAMIPAQAPVATTPAAPLPHAVPDSLREAVEITRAPVETIAAPEAEPVVAAAVQTAPEPKEDNTVYTGTTLASAASATTPTAAERVALAMGTTTPNGLRWVSGPKPKVVETSTPQLAYAEPVTPAQPQLVAAAPAKTARVGTVEVIPPKSQDALPKGEAPARIQNARLDAKDSNNSIVVKTVAVKPIDLNSEPTHNVNQAESVEPVAAPVEVAVAPQQAPKPQISTPVRTGWFIQIGATDNVGSAEQLLERARVRAAQVLASAEPFTEPVAKGDATLYRARFAGFNEKTAQAACKALKRNAISCFAIKN